MRAAIDIGGTFTDVLLFDDEENFLWGAKVSSDTQEPARAFISGLQIALATAKKTLDQVDVLVHGTTLVTNMLLEGKTAPVGMLVTKGFRDLLEIGRQQRPSLYDLMADRRSPLVPRHRIREVDERVDADGQEVVPLNVEIAENMIRDIKDLDAESLAIVLLFSFLRPDNENKLAQLAQKYFPEDNIFISSQVSPEFREFERASTTVVAAAVAPKVQSYMQAIREKLDETGWRRNDLYVMHSGGGTLPPSEAIRNPHTLVESGPAAGIIAAAQLAQSLELDKVIAFDMGGTTAKAGLVLDGAPLHAAEYEVGGEVHHGGKARGSGYPVRFPMIDVAECGAGAGSIAWVDAGGHLKVGPKSAGAFPGPACYGNGGNQPTVTDAYLALGYIDPGYFLGGEMLLSQQLSVDVLNKQICLPMGMNLSEAALGILTIANANMLRILRLVSIERGFDPQEFTLVAYGGAGPLHATTLADQLSIHRVIVPRFPGLFSALGLLQADVSTDFSETVMVALTPEYLDHINVGLDHMRAKADGWFQRLDSPEPKRTINVSADLRYQRQNFELNISLPGNHIEIEHIDTIQTQFHKAHTAEYGHCSLGETIQVVNLRLQAIRSLAKPILKPLDENTIETPPTASAGSRLIWFDDGQMECQVYKRQNMEAMQTLDGPAIIQEKEATTLVNDMWHLCMDRFGNLVLEKK